MKRGIIIFGYFGRGNLGDETNLQRLVATLKKGCPERKITVIAANPERIAAQLDVRSIDRFDLLKICSVLFQSRFLIGGCGNVFQDRTSLRSLLYYSVLVFLAKLQRCRVILYGQGIGPIRTQIGKWIAARVFSMVDLMILRDRVSVGALCELEDLPSELHFTAEPLLAVNEISAQKVQAVWEGIASGAERKIGLVVQENELTTAVFWKRLIEGLLLIKDTALYLIGMDQSNEAAWRELALNTGSVWLLESGDWERLQSLIGGFNLVVSVKLHGLVAAVNQGIPCFGLAVDPKIEGFCLQLDIPYYLFSGQPEPFELARRILEYLEKPLAERVQWLEIRNFWKALAQDNENILLAFLKAD